MLSARPPRGSPQSPGWPSLQNQKNLTKTKNYLKIRKQKLRTITPEVTEHLLELSVADDVVELLVVPDAASLPGAIATVARETFKYFTSYGAEPNLAMGKTNVLPVFWGTGAPVAKRDLNRLVAATLDAVRGRAATGRSQQTTWVALGCYGVLLARG